VTASVKSRKLARENRNERKREWKQRVITEQGKKDECKGLTGFMYTIVWLARERGISK